MSRGGKEHSGRFLVSIELAAKHCQTLATCSKDQKSQTEAPAGSYAVQKGQKQHDADSDVERKRFAFAEASSQFIKLHTQR